MTGVGSTIEKVGRHLRWAREEGVRRLIEEDDLDPVVRTRRAWSKWRWRAAEGVRPGQAVPVWLVGLQRSGTNMLVRGLEASPEFEVHNENDRRAFEDFQLRDDAQVTTLIARSRHRFVLFKPLCDSHRVVHLLEHVRAEQPGRAIWAYRSVDGRVRSALSKFGDHNLVVLRDLAAGRGLDRWQVQGISEATRELLASFDYDEMSPATAAALFWYVRNSLYFDLALDERDDVVLASYDLMVRDPAGMMSAVCELLGVDLVPALYAHVDDRAGAERLPLAIDRRVRERCDELTARLDAALASPVTRARG